MARTRANVTTDHGEIRRWAEERGAQPACVRKTGGDGDIGMIRLDFPGYSGEQSLEHISWDEWFQKFDESGLALLHQDTLATGGKSNFNKLIARETAQARKEGNYGASRRKQQSGRGRKSAQASTGRSGTASSDRTGSARAKRASTSNARGEGSTRTRSASSRTTSSAVSSRGRKPGRAVSRSKQASGSREIPKSSGTAAGRSRGRTGTGSREAVARSTRRRSTKRNPERVAKTARRSTKGAENVIRMERGQGSRRSSRVTKRGAAKTVGATARRKGNAAGRKKAA